VSKERRVIFYIFILALEVEMLTDIFGIDLMRRALPLVLTAGIVGAALAFAFSG
jgi:small-conductance mechanosensitive channel